MRGMQLDWKPAWLVLILGATVVLCGAGCSGINTSQSVSPATFLVPGFFGQAPVPSAPSGSVGTSVETSDIKFTTFTVLCLKTRPS